MLNASRIKFLLLFSRNRSLSPSLPRQFTEYLNMIVSADSELIEKNGNEIILDYCRINQRTDEIQFICDSDSHVLAYTSGRLVEEALSKHFSCLKKTDDLFLQAEDLIRNAKGCMIHTQVNLNPALREILDSLGFCAEQADATLYPVFQTPAAHHLHNVSIHLKPKQTLPEHESWEDSMSREWEHIPSCLIDSRTGLFLDCNNQFLDLVGKEATTVLRSRCDEIGLGDLLLAGTLNADRRCLFSAQLNAQGTSRNWAISESVTLYERSCLKLWCLRSSTDTSHLDPYSDDLADAFLDTWKDKPEKVLICDDNELLLDTCSSIMSWARINYRVALNGKEALNLLENEDFDVIFLDLNMPRLNGFDTARMIKQSTRSYSGIPIIAMTATPPLSMDRGRQLKYFDAVLQKPFDIEDIRQSIRAGREIAEARKPAHRGFALNENPAEALEEASDYEPTSFMFLFKDHTAQLENLRNTMLSSLKRIETEALDYHCRKQVKEFVNLLHKAHSMAKTMGAVKLMKTIHRVSEGYEEAGFDGKEQLFELLQQTLSETQAFYNNVEWSDFIPAQQVGSFVAA